MLMQVDYPGWIRQQLVKLGCARLLKTPYYLVVDADVLYVRNITSTTLFKQSECIPASPVCDASHTVAYQAMGDSYPIADRTENQVGVCHSACLSVSMLLEGFLVELFLTLLLL